MSRSHPKSIRLKLISLYVGLLSVIFVCFGAYIYWGFQQFLVHALEQSLTRRAHQIASTILEELPSRGDAYVAGEIQARFAPELNERVIRISDASQHVVYASRNADLLSSFLVGPVPAGMTEGKAVSRREFPDRGFPLRVIALGRRLSNGNAYTVEVGAPEDEIAMSLRGLLIMLAIGFPVLIILAILGGYSLLGRALSPVNEIVNAAERITFKNLSQRLPVPPTGDEFERISEALNRMIQRLEEAFQIANRFSADASHELRTPLTIIRGELEALAGSPSLPDQSKERVADMLEEVERLGRIVEGLLLVSRLEAGETQMKFEPVNLGELTDSIADQMELMGEDKLLTLTREIKAGVIVEGDSARLRQVVVNLLDNAIKYTPEGGTVRLRVKVEENHGVLEVSDTGIGITPEALPHVFNRFFRSEEAKAGRLPGTGLGLSIVQSITEALGGSVRAESRHGLGTLVRVQLPLIQQKKNV